jgi:anti-anti-sigma factor
MVLSPGLNYTLNELDGFYILGLSGSLTVISFEALISVVHNLTESENIVIDMEGVDFLTSSGINALVDISFYAKERGHRVILMHISDDIIDLIDFVDYYSHFIFAGNIEEAKLKIEHYV